MKNVVILAIESSCDDTSAAVIRDGILLSNVTASQGVHEEFGGVVPELASRAHQLNIVPVVDAALKRAGVEANELSAIAFTRGPGLLGSLLVGTSFAKGMALSQHIPLVEVNHLQAHILAHFIKTNNQYPIGGTPSNSVASNTQYSVQIQDKRHLYAHGGEDLFFQPAQERCIFEYKGVKILLLVCYDLRFPVWARNQSGSDYDIILVVANWPDIRIQYWDALIAARATENQCYIAAVNCVGDDGMGLHYNGHSVAYDTRLQPIVSFADDEEGTKIADFDIAKLHHFREVLPLWKDVDHFEIKKI